MERQESVLSGGGYGRLCCDLSAATYVNKLFTSLSRRFLVYKRSVISPTCRDDSVTLCVKRVAEDLTNTNAPQMAAVTII